MVSIRRGRAAIAAAMFIWCGVETPAFAQSSIRRTWSRELRLNQARGRGDRGDRGPSFDVETISRTIKAGAGTSLSLENISGNIVITGGSGSEIKLQAVKRARANDAADAKRQGDLVRVEILEQAGRVEVRTVYPRERDIHVSVDYTVEVPAEVAVSSRSISGDVRVSRVKGELMIETVSGSVEASSASRLTSLKAVSGDVIVKDGAAETSLRASSVSGSVRLTNVKARDLDVQTVSGDLSAQQVEARRATLESVSGSITYAGPLAGGGRYDMKSHSGDIQITVGTNEGFELDARSFSGEIHSDLALNVRSSTDDGRPSRARSRTMRATYGAAGALLTLSTFSGSIGIK